MDIDYKRDIHIDENALDVEWLEQPNLALRYGNHLANKRNEVSDLKERLEFEEAELTNRVNADPEGCTGKQKVYKPDLEAYFWTVDSYKKIREELKKAKSELEYAELAYQEIAYTRKKALEQLVTLHGQQYFAAPKVPRDLHKERQKQKEQDSNIGNKINKK